MWSGGKTENLEPRIVKFEGSPRPSPGQVYERTMGWTNQDAGLQILKKIHDLCENSYFGEIINGISLIYSWSFNSFWV